ncbi:MAG: YibE/F family protein [Patescibacteria group bacterium]
MKKLFLAVVLAAQFLALPVFAQSAPTAPAPVVATSTSDNSSGSEGVDGAAAANAAPADQVGQYERASVEGVRRALNPTSIGGEQTTLFQVKFLSGPLKGQTKDISSDISSNPYALQPKQGDKVVIFMQRSGDDWQLFIEGFDRRAALIWLVILFVVMLIVLSGWQGFKTALSIAISIALIGYVLIPAFLSGMNPVPVAILLTGVFTLLSTGLSSGWNRKAIITAIGTMGGALVAYGVSIVFADWSHASGLATDDDRLFFDKNPMLNPRGLMFAGIIIASAGVVEDVAVSIVSGISEVKRHNPRATKAQLFTSGMIVGKDHMSALANTLVYAYVGSSLSTLLLYKQFGGSWLKFVNFDSVVDEVIRSLAGTIGLIFTVPITALLAAWFMSNEDAQQPDAHRGHKH